jgi:CheY-like chemotaxis protein
LSNTRIINSKQRLQTFFNKDYAPDFYQREEPKGRLMTDKNNPEMRDTRDLAATSTGRFIRPRDTGPLDRKLPWVLEFRVVGTASTIQTQLKDVMVLGREDPDHNVFPEIDLGPYHAYTQGVSRRHAVILVRDGRITIKDLGSTNGTRLNDYDLLPEQEYRLRHGDELILGQLKLQVLFAVVPARQDEEPLAEAVPVEAKAPVVGGGRTILIVADDADVGVVFSTALEQVGFKVKTVNNAVYALADVTEAMPDAIVLDLVLPDLSGLDFVRYVRKNSGERYVPTIVISGATGGFQMNKAFEAGADVFLGKPVSIEELVLAVNAALLGEKYPSPSPSSSSNASPSPSPNPTTSPSPSPSPTPSPSP